MKKEDCYFLGTITRKHGLKGNLILKLDTDQPELYQKLASVLVEIKGLLVPFFIEKQSWSKQNALNILIKNITEQLADQLIGKEVYLPLSTLPELKGKQFYYHEVIGFTIFDSENRSYGIINAVNDQTAQHHFILDLNGKTVIIPIIKDWILDVDRSKKQITMQLPDGLLEVFLSDQSQREELDS